MKTARAVASERISSDRRMRFNPIRGLTAATLARHIEEADAGRPANLARLCAAIEARDENLATVAPQRYGAAARLPWDVAIVEGEAENPAALRQRAALLYAYNNVRATDAADRDVRGGLSLLLRQAARALGHGKAVHDLAWRPLPPVWDTRADQPVVRAGLSLEAALVPLWFFECQDGQLRYLASEAQTIGDDLAEAEWFVASSAGLLLPSAINYLFQRMALNDWARFNRDFGQPLIDAVTDAAKGSADWAALRDDLAELFGAKALLHGRGAAVQFAKATEGAATFDALLERLERRVLRLWTGGELAVQSGASDQVGATLQKTTQGRLLEADAAWLSEQVNEQLDRPILRWWFGDAAAEQPLAYFKLSTPQDENVDAELKKDTALINWGGQITLGALAERHGRTVANGNDFASPARPAAPSVTGRGADAAPTELANELPADLEAQLNALLATADPAEFDRQLAALKQALSSQHSALSPADTTALEAALAIALKGGVNALGR